MRRFLLLLLALSSLALWCLSTFGQEVTTKPAKDLILGKAGSTYISEDEFVRQFELNPGLYRHRASRLNEEKLMVMYSLIAEKLLAQEAEARGLDRDSSVVAGIGHLTDLLSRDELYREEVTGKVTVSRAEINAGMRNALRRLFLTFFLFDKEEDARFFAAENGGKSLRNAIVDSSISAFKDTATIDWGTAEAPVDQAAFALTVGQVSPVVRSSQGYLVMEITHELPSPAFLALEPRARRDRVESTLRLRKERARMEEFLNGFMPGKKGYTVSSMLKTVAVAVSHELVPSDKDSVFVLSDDAHRRLFISLQSVLGDTFFVAGTRAYSVANVLDRLVTHGFSVQSMRPLAVANKLNAECRKWVEQDLLAQEALHRGLDKTPQVEEQLKEWKSSYLAQIMEADIEKDAHASDADVYRYLNERGNPLPSPMVQVRTLHTTSIEEMRQAMTLLEHGEKLENVVRLHSSVPEERERGGLSQWFSIGENPPIGDLASEMAVGQTYGPVQDKGSILLFQLVARNDSVAADTSSVRKVRETKEKLERMLKNELVNRFVAKAAGKRGFSVFEDRLAVLKVSPVPMMSFRALGFGGRMFASPLIPRLFDWANGEKEKPQVAP